MIYNLLCSIAALSWIWDTSLPSIVLFGEYPYPSIGKRQILRLG